MLTRILEPEVMDSEEDARAYDAMDHAAVNSQFVTDFVAAMLGLVKLDPPYEILDLGVGTAQIPIELCRRMTGVRVVAVDAAATMLSLGRANLAAAKLSDRIELVLADAKRLPFAAGRFAAVVSNSIVHHIGDPAPVIAEAVRVAAPGGLLFHRDLARPNDDAELIELVSKYAGTSTPYQRQLFGDSLRAALAVEEVKQLVVRFGFAPETVQMTSDRHWTWKANAK